MAEGVVEEGGDMEGGGGRRRRRRRTLCEDSTQPIEGGR